MPKRALITGITGQDGSYLTEWLLSHDYEVHGIIRRASSFNTGRLDHIYQDPHTAGARLYLHHGDLSCGEQLNNLIYNVEPEEIYHLGAQSHVKVSFEVPEFTGDVTGLGTTRILEAVRRSGIKARFYQASSSEMFASNGILFNHESPRRGETFVSRKISRAVAGILAGKQNKLYLGNLQARRDWGYTPEYVEAMWLILQQAAPGDYVVGTGETHSVQEFVEEAFGYVNLDWKAHVEVDPRYFRPTEVDYLQADASKMRREMQWEPRVTFKELVRIMIDADMEESGLTPMGEGVRIMGTKFGKWHRWRNAVSDVVNAAPGAAIAP